MISLDEGALMCDLAETYGIYDYRSLPVQTVATFCVGLGENSRIKRKIRGDTVPTDTLLLSMIYDNISRVLVALGVIDEPKYISEVLLGTNEKPGKQRTFTDAESYEEERRRIIEGIRNGRN